MGEQEIENVIKILKSQQQEPDRYYVLEENDILKISDSCPSTTPLECFELLATLRINSVAHRFNKIGKNVDAILFDYLFRHNN